MASSPAMAPIPPADCTNLGIADQVCLLDGDLIDLPSMIRAMEKLPPCRGGHPYQRSGQGHAESELETRD
ncbi:MULTISPECIES: hypothetical protein [Acidithiobacillus]|uniref:Uncharacterized protein n=2 Tax=Acidithiobacillus TaxID=119977 RepID=A0A179BEN3_ACIFR|nr:MULTISPECIES: hypothetical protein [Acidithiobacillus]MEB8486414.1 hypothetical protein [Acidithiobacillus ferriphilus]MEB8491317.1 hypothetical protein [Acidithiobacillus ferriphilus]MEB8493112.1 hypothetical protein [Acidithiobacillus ferriphilus]MEB8513192.1 hypothetical protein [Acidithiobacillus ferriphilus]MEB8520568.1 hypothetical protein [Acidithiobacillus ferriphilus]